jgi:hypothetical protein
MSWLTKILCRVIPIFFLVGCVANPARDTATAAEILNSKGFDISESILESYKRYINNDTLEKRVYFQGSDYDDFLLGTTFRLVTFRYEPGDDYLIAEFRSMEEDWIFSEYISVYVGTEKIVDRSSGFSRRTNTSIVDAGNMGSTVYTHEIYSLSLPLENAKKIAMTDKANLTVRFGGGDAGYVDSKPHPLANMKGLRAVVNLADYFDVTEPSKSLAEESKPSAKQEERVNTNTVAQTSEPLKAAVSEKTAELSGIQRELASGSIKLIKPGIFKGYGAAWKMGRLLPKLEILHAEGLWVRLAETVHEINLGDNLSYYYLGRAAYELGYINAATKYLDQSIEESKRALTGKCIACNGIKLPAEAELIKAKIQAAN